MSDQSQPAAVSYTRIGEDTPFLTVDLTVFQPAPGTTRRTEALLREYYTLALQAVLPSDRVAATLAEFDIATVSRMLTALDLDEVNKKRELILSRPRLENAVSLLRHEGWSILTVTRQNPAIFAEHLPVTQREINLIEAIIRAAGAFPVRQFLYQGMTIVMGAPSRRDRQQFAA